MSGTNAIKKLLFQEMPQDYSPRRLPEIVRLAGELNRQEAVVYRQGTARPVLFETERLVIRRFVPEDAPAVQELAIDRHHSEMRNRDHLWPTDEQGCREATEWFSSQENMWAVCLKPDCRLIGMVVTETSQASFARDEKGEPIYFTGCKLVLERERWSAQ